jgi:flagellar biosynthesis protein FliR
MCAQYSLDMYLSVSTAYYDDVSDMDKTPCIGGIIRRDYVTIFLAFHAYALFIIQVIIHRSA